MKKRDQLQLFQKQLSNTQDFDSDKKSFKSIIKAFDYIQKNDLVSLKAAYQGYISKKLLFSL